MSEAIGTGAMAGISAGVSRATGVDTGEGRDCALLLCAAGAGAARGLAAGVGADTGGRLTGGGVDSGAAVVVATRGGGAPSVTGPWAVGVDVGAGGSW
ncbi:hypothetical protein OVA07_14535 [Novosphingobium sp. SL115]|uniref:hypothetical protein n=1 Tax=Novosphingobium sp. SL115 TaxID=2995150 RepID=UPI002276F9D2|nr:hypothetical protein [Novosphingobium sp. SL115]MCY1672220.1 hypothetical protein [Novosphingobium sp. SL115]